MNRPLILSAVLGLSACSGAPASAPLGLQGAGVQGARSSISAPGSVVSKRKSGQQVQTVYAVVQGGFEVGIYDPTTGKQTGGVTNDIKFAVATAVDAAGDLFVSCYQGIEEFPPGSDQPTRVLDTQNNSATSLALRSDGTIYAADNGVVEVYAPNQTEPAYSLSDSGFTPQNVALDSNENVYVLGSSSGGASWSVLGFAKNSQGPPTETLPLSGINGPGGLVIDSANNLLISAYGFNGRSNPGIFVYPPGAESPSKEIGDTPKQLRNGAYVMAFGPNFSQLYVKRGETRITWYSYPSGKVGHPTIGLGHGNIQTLWGIAVYPPAPIP